MQGTVAHFDGENLDNKLIGHFELEGEDVPKSICERRGTLS
jgi:hypothetical protein